MLLSEFIGHSPMHTTGRCLLSLISLCYSLLLFSEDDPAEANHIHTESAGKTEAIDW